MKSVVASAMVMAMGLAACRVSVETQTRYTRADGDVNATAAEAYVAGDKISIKLLGVEASGIGVSLNGGVIVNAADTDKVSVSARVIGYGYSEDEADATTAIGNVAQGVTVVKEGGTWVVTCPKQKQGDASAGCELLTVTVPRGTVASPLDVSVDSELGTINANFRNDVVSNLDVKANGASPEILAQAEPAVGGRIRLVSDEGPVRLDLRADVSVDSVQLTGRTEEEATAGEEFSDSSFAGANFNGTTFSIGTPGAGAASVVLSGGSVRLKNPGDN